MEEDEGVERAMSLERKLSVKMNQRRTTNKGMENDPELEKLEKELAEECDKEDKELDEKEKPKALTKGEKFKRILALSYPKVNIFLGIFVSII